MDRGSRRWYRFRQVDVFTERPYGGNPLAVVIDADPLSTEQMRAIAREMNLSETSFVLSSEEPGADYRMRIFTPTRELPFAGHPSLGTAHVLLEEGILQSGSTPAVFHQQVGIGVLPIEIQPASGPSPRIVMTQGKPMYAELIHDLSRLSAALGIGRSELEAAGLVPQIVSTGLRQLMVPVGSLSAVREMKPDLRSLGRLEEEFDFTGCSAFSVEKQSPDAPTRVRFFSPASGIAEDPATGSAAGALGAYMLRNELLDVRSNPLEFTIDQGEEMGRPSRIYVGVYHDGSLATDLRVGGHSVVVLKGELLA